MPWPSLWLEPVGRDADAVVEDLDHGMAGPARRADRDAALADLARQAVLDGVLDERLQDHARHDDVEAALVDRLLDDQDGPNRTRSMSRYSSMAASSSRSVTKCSWLRSSRRSRPESFDDERHAPSRAASG